MSPEEQEKLVLENQKLVPYIARQFSKIPELLEELISEGNIALVEASRGYKEEKGSFKIYASIIIRNRIRKYQLPKNQVSFETIVNSEGLTLSETLKDSLALNPENELIKRENHKALLKSWEILSNKQMFVVARYYGLNGLDPLTMEEIGKLIGCSKQNVQYILKQALELLKKHLISI